MASSKHVTCPFPDTYEPTSLSSHTNDGNGKNIVCLDSEVKHYSSPPTITHGTTTSWSNYSRVSNAIKNGKGIFEKAKENGQILSAWGKTGDKHSEIFRVGGNSGLWLVTGGSHENTGIGFELYRKRTDSNNNNNNAEQHCIFLKRWGVELVNYKNNNTRFWSSDVLATNGNFDGGSTSGKTIHKYDFHQMRFKDASGFAGNDWTVKAVWFNTAVKNGNYTGDATTELMLFDLRFYHDFQASRNSGNSWIKPNWRSYSDRNKQMFKLA